MTVNRCIFVLLVVYGLFNRGARCGGAVRRARAVTSGLWVTS